MSEINDGGPAFPRSSGSTQGHPGMSLRKWFAGLAMQSMFAGPGASDVARRDKRYDGTNWSFVVAANAYEMADEMIKAGKVKK